MWSKDDIGTSNLDKYVPALDVGKPVAEYLENLMTGLTTVNPKTHKQTKVNMVRMMQNLNEILKAAWVPKECTVSGAIVLPEHLKEFGSPWLMGCNHLCTRATSDKTPFVGMPAYLFTFDQPMLVLAWNLKEVPTTILV